MSKRFILEQKNSTLPQHTPISSTAFYASFLRRHRRPPHQRLHLEPVRRAGKTRHRSSGRASAELHAAVQRRNLSQSDGSAAAAATFGCRVLQLGRLQILPSRFVAQSVFWGRAAIERWKRTRRPHANDGDAREGGGTLQTWADKRLSDKVQLLVITAAFEQHARRRRPRVWRRDINAAHGRLAFDGDEAPPRDWTHLVPDYGWCRAN